MHVPPSRHSNSWSSGITMRIGGWALRLVAVNVPFVCVTFIHVAAVVCIVALTASLPFRILIPTSKIGRTNLLLHWCCIVAPKARLRIWAAYTSTKRGAQLVAGMGMWPYPGSSRKKAVSCMAPCGRQMFLPVGEGTESEIIERVVLSECLCFEPCECRTHYLYVYMYMPFLTAVILGICITYLLLSCVQRCNAVPSSEEW